MLAGPNSGNVVGGAATIQGQGTANVIVNQSTQNAIINWQTFNIGSGETTKIYMPGSNSTQLDRVTGGQGPSQILGTLYSNGKVFLVNPDGILFGMGARINVGSLVATTNDIANKDFMAGRYNFSIPGNPNASIVNLGTITAQTGGFAALVAPGVRNTGTIIAKLGTIALASGNAFTLDMYGDNLITLGLDRLDLLAGHRCRDRQAAQITGQQRWHAQGQRRHRGAHRGRGAQDRQFRHQQFGRDRSEHDRHPQGHDRARRRDRGCQIAARASRR